MRAAVAVLCAAWLAHIEFNSNRMEPMLQYAADLVGNEAAYPRDLRVRADINRWLQWEGSHWFPSCYVFLVENCVKPLLGGQPDPAVLDAQAAATKLKPEKPQIKLGFIKLTDIAPLVANYAQLIGHAEKLEKDGAEAAALTAWLSAQDLNPASPACGAAVKRLARSVAESAVIRSEGTVPTPPAADDIPAPPTK